MELLVSAVAGDLVNRFVSFLINRCKSEEKTEEKMERLQNLLLRVHMIVEEAEERYITNSRMLLQLKKLLDTMYQGYHVLDTIKYKTLLCRSRTENKVSSFGDMSVTTPIYHRFCNMESSSTGQELQSTIDSLDSILSNMNEFVLLLEGCEHMFRSPYDSYLYIDNFMFGRHVEKQQIINILLQDNLPPNVPTVLPIIGGTRVGKKTLIAHVCNNEKVRSHFSSVLHLNEENIGRMEHERPSLPGRCLVVVEFTSDVDDENWLKYYSIAKRMGKGSKIIIVSRIAKLSRFGTVKPIHLNSLTHEEYSYLFKVMAFGSTNPEEQPQMALLANDLAAALGGSLIPGNVCADMLRKNQSVKFWLNIVNRYRNVVENNFSRFGEHPKNIMDKDRPVDITRFAPLSSAKLRLMPPHSKTDSSKRALPKVMFGDLIAGTAVLPNEFELVAWESRIPPYKKFVNFASFCEDEVSQYCADSPSKKRKRFDKVT